MPLRDPSEFQALVAAVGGPAAAARRLRQPVAWLHAALAEPPLWAVVVLRRARLEAVLPPPGTTGVSARQQPSPAALSP